MLISLETVSSHPLLLCLGLLLCYVLLGALYRLYLSPIAGFPGPKLTAVTLWYEFYHDVVRKGKFHWEIKKMHDKYGPIVRINPYEVHIDDPDYYDEVFSGPTRPRDKWYWQARLFGNSTSGFGTVPHSLHRLRRSPVNVFFSKKSVSDLEPVLRASVETLCGRLEEFRQTKQPVITEYAFNALTTDVITAYSFAKSYDYLSAPDFRPGMYKGIILFSGASHMNKQFGWMPQLFEALPLWVVSKANPYMEGFIELRKGIEDQIKAIMANENANGSPEGGQKSIFQTLLKSDLPPAEKSLPRLVDEGQTLIAAGAFTTAQYLAVTTYYILSSPTVYQKLKAELIAAIPNPSSVPSLRELEQLSYLSAVVLEGLRITYGLSSRLTRVATEEDLVYKGWVIPAGTPISMSSIFIHDNPDLFPSPREFKPERWLVEDRQRLEKYLCSFSKGTRVCLGINLAKAEIVLTLAHLFRRFDLELFETDLSDVEMAHDFFIPVPRLDSKGVRVILK